MAYVFFRGPFCTALYTESIPIINTISAKTPLTGHETWYCQQQKTYGGNWSRTGRLPGMSSWVSPSGMLSTYPPGSTLRPGHSCRPSSLWNKPPGRRIPNTKKRSRVRHLEHRHRFNCSYKYLLLSHISEIVTSISNAFPMVILNTVMISVTFPLLDFDQLEVYL